MDLIILGVGFAAQKVKDKVSDYRSPIIPFPPNALELAPSTDSQNLSIVRIPSTTTTDSNSLLTERVIIERHKEWKMRAVSLWIRQTALIDAKARNFDSCWAGAVSRTNMRRTKEAIREAKWVESRLSEALEWCQERNVKKMPLKKIVVLTKNGRKASPRPTHDGYPEALLELPWPLPIAPTSRELRLTIPIPPSIEWNEENPEVPPLYSAELDEKSGEMRLENVRWDPVVPINSQESS
ncbi:hypothetical protein JCM5353_001804 [Sporobolomyces roseus]